MFGTKHSKIIDRKRLLNTKLVSGCTVLPDSQETKLGSRNQEASQSADKNTEIVLVPWCAWKCVPTAISGGVNISEAPGCHLLWQLSSQWGSQKLLKGLVSHELTAYLSLLNLFLTQWIMAILSKGSTRPFQERCAITRARAHTHPKVFRCVINHTHK